MSPAHGPRGVLLAALLLVGTTASAQVTFDCQTIQERAPATGLGANPKAVASVPLARQQQGYVRVGGGCEVSRFGYDSAHAEVMVQNAPDGDFGWRCKGADPALVINPAWAKASVTFCKASAPNVSSLRLQCKTLSSKTGPSRNPLAEVSLTPQLATEGYVVVSGGCDSSHALNGSIHAENVVVSKPTANGKGWRCQAADPPNHPQDATVTASLVACQLAVDPAQAALLIPKPALRCAVSQGVKTTGMAYPRALAAATGKVISGGCDLSYAGNGSVHAQFMVQHGPQADGAWSCWGADPPLISNPGSAQASVLSCGITTVPATTPLPAPTPTPSPTPTARKNPVVIVGGTLASEILYWTLESRLDRDGYQRFFFELPSGGLIDLHESARQLKFKVADVLLQTGASKVHLIGHSQGGAVARAYVRDFGNASVESIISLGTPHKGTDDDPLLALVARLLFNCTGTAADPLPCKQMKAGSAFIAEINTRPPNDPVYYTNINTLHDVFTKANSNGKMDNCDRASPSGEALQCNVTVQDFCKDNLVEHVGLASNGVVYSGIRQALEHRKIALNCTEL
ncbi:alpha/beta fold hydrolase [Myxococcus sp. CA033]|uniref:alpha/beta fold hydrolase n=1 Tax=Myxococcus sp. CA033 TaxID=2741516 RepID=UPI00157B3DB8|nr:alpha/beta fold hydrolase [Myxococcus sp. CA033]NTX38288.1 alpha/beta fold hydrolase [Myxococcus sp. CA033]